MAGLLNDLSNTADSDLQEFVNNLPIIRPKKKMEIENLPAEITLCDLVKSVL